MQTLLRGLRTLAGLLLAALAAVLTFNVASLAMGNCAGKWAACVDALWPFIVIEYAFALPFAAVAGGLFVVLRYLLGTVNLLHLSAVGSAVSLSGGLILGFVRGHDGVVLFLAMGLVASAVFWLVVVYARQLPQSE